MAVKGACVVAATIAAIPTRAKKAGIPFTYNRKWRDPKDLEVPKDIKPVVRFKSKISGNSIVNDLVQGEVNISNSTIEDFIILRKDGSPTYQLSAVVDDHLMNISHVIRGDDHKINTLKQKQIYEAMKWKLPEFAHIPLIHSTSGKKLSKRDHASTLVDYIKIGILPEALRNYLLRLGWSYKDKEIFTLEESIQLFNLSGIGKSPSKLDMDRILSINEHYIKNIDEKKLYEMFKIYSEKYKKKIDNKYEKNLINSIHFLKNKAKKLEDIYQNARYVLNDNIQISSENLKLLDDLSKNILKDLREKRTMPGIIYIVEYFSLLLICGYMAYITWGTYWSILWFWIYGTIYSFSGACEHECRHRTFFKQRILNDIFQCY